MKVEEFIQGLAEELEIEENLTITTKLKDLEEWDSLRAMILIGYVSNQFGVTINAEDIIEITTIESLINKIGKDKFN